MNRYPLWKNAIVLAVVFFGVLYALPNIFAQNPSIEISSTRRAVVDDAFIEQVTRRLDLVNISYIGADISDKKLIVRLSTPEAQLKAMETLESDFGKDYTLALTTVADLPGWMRSIHALPMFLGLDLRGGVHIVIDVDMDAAINQAAERNADDVKSLMQKNKIRYRRVRTLPDGVRVTFNDADLRDRAQELAAEDMRNLEFTEGETEGQFYFDATMSEAEQKAVKKFALEQNMTTLRSRVNQLGVSEPVIQQQGQRRIVVQLPGVQDPSKIKELLGATATLEYRLVDTEHSVMDALEGKVPLGSKVYRERNGQPVLLKKRVIVTGNQITNASAGFDQRTSRPSVNVSLDSAGAKRMLNMTTDNVGKPMAVVFIETEVQERVQPDGTIKKIRIPREEVISIANILEPFGPRFQTTGLDSPAEAHDLALLLRAGALAAPIEIVEERTVGPSLGQDSIDQGFRSVVIGMVLVMVFMGIYYRVFGLVANAALVLNLVLIVAVLSMLQATLTLPGIAGIVLTVGMAVDANVLIFERIREEIAVGSTPQASIQAGYEKALSTIVDANITTLIAAIVLFSFGTGPIKGFAITLFIGILSSMFTAIMGSRAVINLVYGGRRVSKLAI